MPLSSPSPATWAANGPHLPGTIDWTGLSVVDPAPEPPRAARPPGAGEHEACVRSASRFYAHWGE